MVTVKNSQKRFSAGGVRGEQGRGVDAGDRGEVRGGERNGVGGVSMGAILRLRVDHIKDVMCLK